MVKKTMLGHRVRRLRRDRGLTQAQMAERLGISPSYLNLIENNQRPITVELLLRIGQNFDVDLGSFSEDEAARLTSGLQEVFSDPLFRGSDLRRQDMADVATAAPAAAQAVLALYQAYRSLRDDTRLMAERAAVEQGAAPFGAPGATLDEVGDFLHARGNYLPELEAAAEEVWRVGNLETGELARGLADYLDRELTIRVKIMPVEVMGPTRRRYDRHSRRILLNELLPVASRNFQLAVQIALIKYRALLDQLVGDARFAGEDAAKLGRIALANYLGGAILMPYDRFYRAATALRYDTEVLARRFEASFEQICHRLTMLQRPGAKGIPFFLIRVDKAGNVSKRFSANKLHFARFGGACPRWNLHDAFRSPGRIHTQVSEMPDGSRYFSIARTVTKPGLGYRMPGQTYAIALGCDIAYAAQLVYADGMDMTNDGIAVPIGLHCRICERLDCAQRAFPPLHHKLGVDENVRGATPYLFEPQG